MPKAQTIQPVPQLPLHRRFGWFHVFMACMIALIVTLLVTMPNPGRTFALATTYEPENYTELYFDDPAGLPRAVSADEPAKFSYRIVNRQSTTTTYHSYVTVYENGVARQIQTDNPTVKPGQFAELTVIFTPRQSNSSIKVEVNLPAQHQSIHFGSQS